MKGEDKGNYKHVEVWSYVCVMDGAQMPPPTLGEDWIMHRRVISLFVFTNKWCYSHVYVCTYVYVLVVAQVQPKKFGVDWTMYEEVMSLFVFDGEY